VVRKLEMLAAGAETLQAYLRQIAGLPRLTPNEERDLARRVRQHDDEHALSRLVEANLRVVVAFARRYRHLGVPALDLIHEGNIGLIEAARVFDPESRLSFLDHAYWWIRQAMLHLLAESHVGEMESVEGAGTGLHIAALQAGIEHGPAAAGLTDAIETDEQNETHPGAGFVAGAVPWSGQRAESEEPAAEGSVLVALRQPDPDDRVTREALTHTLEAQLASVDPRARQILRLRCGLHGGESWNVEQVAQSLGISAERVLDIECDARHALSRHRSLQSHLN
jgi:RNA polymerase primary sigma factor